MREEDEIIGNLTDANVKWLIMFTYYQFQVRNAILAFDFHSVPKRIYITPMRGQHSFSVTDWARAKFRLKWQKVERDLPRHLKLDKFRISFCRVAPKSDYRLEPGSDKP